MINKYKFLVTIVTILLIIMSIANSVFATTITQVIDTSRKGSITLTAYEFINGDENNRQLLPGAEFTIYKVTDSIKTVAAAETYIANNPSSKVSTNSTGTNGVVSFGNLDLGRYFVVETNAPRNVFTRVESFLTDVPSVNASGTEWNYDIQVSPKNVTVYADATLTKTNEKNEVMQNVVFKLQKQVNGSWRDYDIPMNLITNSEGKFVIHNLEVGKYRLMEIASNVGYIVDSTDTQEFEVKLGEIEFYPTMSNETVKVNKYVKLDDGSYGKHIGAYTKDTVSWKIETTVPSIIAKMATYEIIDDLSDGLAYVNNSVQVYGIKNSNRTLLVNNFYSVDINGRNMKINFDNSRISNYDKIEVLYNTTIDANTINYGLANTNTAKVRYTDVIQNNGTEASTYTTIVDSDATAEVHTGEVLIYKTDGTTKLPDAKFKIATTKEAAEAGHFVTDANGNDIEMTSDENGYVVFRGLKYGGNDDTAATANTYYWIVETQSPSYLNERGETKYYHLLDEPVRVAVNANSGTYTNGTTVEVVNRKGFLLPKTGAVSMVLLTTAGIATVVTSIIIGKKKKNNEE